MQAELTEKNDVKIFILYLLDQVAYPLDFASIIDIVLQDNMVGYFDFAECFAELIESKNIEEIKADGGATLYAITEQGKQVARELQSDILPYIREKSFRSAVRYLDFQKKGWVPKCSYVERSDGKFEFTCKILEHKKDIVCVTMVLDSRNMLDRMLYNFRENPETVFKGLMSVLTGEINYLL